MKKAIAVSLKRSENGEVVYENPKSALKWFVKEVRFGNMKLTDAIFLMRKAGLESEIPLLRKRVKPVIPLRAEARKKNKWIRHFFYAVENGLSNERAIQELKSCKVITRKQDEKYFKKLTSIFHRDTSNGDSNGKRICND